MSSPGYSVAEMQGLYGPFTLAERVVQKIWRQQDFAHGHARLIDGRRLEVLHPGQWNLLGGPDFLGARLRFDEQEVTGDVEVHFRAEDWRAHGHARNPAFARVVLHVLLFPPESGSTPACHNDGTEIPTLVLLPLLHRDLEEYAADDALERLTAQDESQRLAELLNQPRDEVAARLRAGAEDRWKQKVRFAQRRVERMGWNEAAHQTALEILGYRRNRANMLAVAERWPLSRWSEDGVVEEVQAAMHDDWHRHGLRPANRPEVRLGQYRQWCAGAPVWPQRLLDWGAKLPQLAANLRDDTVAFRRSVRLGALSRELENDVVSGAVSAGRLHTLVCDGFLPLLAAARAGSEGAEFWFHWSPGDLPGEVRRVLARLGLADGPTRPLCNGWAQGLLAWLIARQQRT
jgi:hypothetical protein